MRSILKPLRKWEKVSLKVRKTKGGKMERRNMLYPIILCLSLTMAGRLFGSFMVDPEPPIYWLPGGQNKPAISAGINSFFAVWEDERAEYKHIYGTRISKDGKVVDTCGILISGGYHKSDPAVAFGYPSGAGDNYLVVWRDSASLCGARISGDEVIDTLGITIMNEDVYSPAVAYDGVSRYMVVWQTMDGDIKGKTVNIDGNVSGLFTICAETGTQGGPEISFNGTNFFVIWSDNRDGYWELYGARVTPDGTVLDSGGIKLVNTCGERLAHDVAFCGGYWLCVWEDTRDGDKDIYGTRVDGDGNVLDDPSIFLNMWDSNYDEYHPAVSSDGEKFIVTYIEDYGHKDVVNVLVQTDGTILSHHYTSNPLVTSRTYTDVAFCDTVFFSLWCHYEPYRYGIVGGRIDKNGNFLDGWYGVNVGITATIQNKPDCVYGGDSVLVVWQDNFMGIMGEMIDLDGNPLKKIVIDFPGKQPALAYTDPYYFCVWHEGAIDSIVRGRRITRDGVAMPETINIVDNISYTPCLDVDGGEGTFCVAWIDPNYPRNVYCSNLDTSGVILQPPINISDAPPTVMSLQSLSVCFNDSNDNYLIAWHEMGMMWWDSIYCTMVAKNGGILYLRVPVGEGWDPSLTFDGTSYFCVWEGGPGLIGRWISVACEPGDTCLIPFHIQNPQVENCGDGYIITGVRYDGLYGKVLGVKLSLDGSIIDSFEVSPGKEPSIAAKDDKYLVTWSSFTPYPYSSYRIWGEYGSFTDVKENQKLEIESQKLEVYPNPFYSTISIRNRVESIRVYDLSGRLVETTNGNTIGKHLKAGIYFLKAEGYKPVKIVKLR